MASSPGWYITECQGTYFAPSTPCEGMHQYYLPSSVANYLLGSAGLHAWHQLAQYSMYSETPELA
ncbi:unnamed protein product, partial [Gadus morhua 'NCC']